MKKHISMILSVAIVLSVFFGIGNTAHAAGASISLSPGSFSADVGETRTVTATVTNTLESENFSGFRIVCAEYGLAFTSDAVLAPGEGTNFDFSFEVKQAMMDKTLTFVVQYQTPTITSWTDGGSATLAVKSKSVALVASMTVSPNQMAAVGDTLELKFSVQNQGEATLKNIAVKIPGVNSGKMLNPAEFTLVANETKTFSYLYKVTAAATLAPVVYYTVNGTGDTLQTAITPAEITIEVRDVKMTFTANPENPQSGETVTMSVDVTNNGNVNYTGVKAYLNGEEVPFPSTTLNAGAHYSKDYERSYLASTDVTFELVLKDQKGETVSISKTVSIELPVDDSEISSKLTMAVEALRPTLTSAGKADFTGNIVNGTQYEFMNIVVTETTQNVEVFKSALLGSQLSASFEYQADITQTTTFNFQLTVTDSAGKTHTINAEPVTVNVTAAETVSDYPSAADITPSAEADGKTASAANGLMIFFIILVVLVIGVGIALLVLWRAQKGSGRPSGGGKPSGNRTAGGRTVPAAAVKTHPTIAPAKRKRPVARGYRDRNNF